MSNYPYILSKAFATHLPHSFCYMFTFHSHICSYIWDATSCYIFAHVYTHLKTILCRTFIEKAIFVLLIHILERQFYIICSYWEAFSCHFQHICTFCKAFSYLFNIHMYMVNNIFTLSRYKENMVQPKPSASLKGKPHQHALTHHTFLHFKNQRLGPPRPMSCFGFYPNFCKLSASKNGNHTYTNPIKRPYSQT